ncbi:MAG: hypothetical protein J7M30_00525, partial [Deltaproteobacteria bacterium]|nr:hypothetical protein [Deltaproteobacteria bacterium]
MHRTQSQARIDPFHTGILADERLFLRKAWRVVVQSRPTFQGTAKFMTDALLKKWLDEMGIDAPLHGESYLFA